MMFRHKAILDFRPPDVTKKHQLQSSWKCTAVAHTGDDIQSYYAWMLSRRSGIILDPSLRRSHVTVVNDRMDRGVFEQGADFFHGKEIEFVYEITPKTNGEHWWLRVHSPDIENIRVSLRLSPQPYMSLHLTIGRANPKYIEHSEYIHRVFRNLYADESREVMYDRALELLNQG
jgi:hypothetical protein